MAVYEKKSRKREAQGLQRFAPTLQVAVLLEHEQATTATGIINEKGALKGFIDRMDRRYKKGFTSFFAPQLEIQVEAEECGVDIKSELQKIVNEHKKD